MPTAPPTIHVDVLIFGGGIAGLWTLARLRRDGYSCILLENKALGSGQTIASQGIIHGGIKYALTGKASAASKAIAEMPGIWQACLRGEGELDLRSARVLSPHQHLWTTGGIGSRLVGVAASKVIRTAVEPLGTRARPAAFASAPDNVDIYTVEEPVLDTRSVVHALADHADAPILRLRAEDPIVQSDSGSVTVAGPEDRLARFAPKRIVLAAGEHNCRLQDLLLGGEEARIPGRKIYQQQLRPLHMVMARGDLPEVFGHCVGLSDKPRVTITSCRQDSQTVVWYIGGQLAEAGIDRASAAQIDAARKELAACVPWVSLAAVRFSSFLISRAEGPPAPGNGRPDEPLLGRTAHVLTAYPIKLAFAPLLASRIESALRAEGVVPHADTDTPAAARDILSTWPRPAIAPFPWDREGLAWI